MRNFFSKLSVSAILAGASVDLVGTLVWNMFLIVIVLFKYKLYFTPPGPTPQFISNIQQIFYADKEIAILYWVFGFGITFFGGYITAERARKNVYINAAVEPFVWVLWCMYSLFTAATFGDAVISFACIFLNPMFALAGAYVYELRKKSHRIDETRHPAFRIGVIGVLVLIIILFATLIYGVSGKPGGLIEQNVQNVSSTSGQ